MSTLYLLDTNILIHLIRNDELGERIRELYNPLLIAPCPLISLVTDGEIRSLAFQFGWGKEIPAGISPSWCKESYVFNIQITAHSSRKEACAARDLTYLLPWHFLYFWPLPHQHGSLRPPFQSAGAPSSFFAEIAPAPSLFVVISRGLSISCI